MRGRAAAAAAAVAGLAVLTGQGGDGPTLTEPLAAARDPRAPVRPALIGTALTMTSLGQLRITTYCPTGTTTASGRWPRRGDAATLDRGLPFGTQLWIDQVGTRTVADRIGHGSDVDLYDNRPGCTAYADRYGVQHLQVAVLVER